MPQFCWHSSTLSLSLIFIITGAHFTMSNYDYLYSLHDSLLHYPITLLPIWSRTTSTYFHAMGCTTHHFHCLLSASGFTKMGPSMESPSWFSLTITPFPPVFTLSAIPSIEKIWKTTIIMIMIKSLPLLPFTYRVHQGFGLKHIHFQSAIWQIWQGVVDQWTPELFLIFVMSSCMMYMLHNRCFFVHTSTGIKIGKISMAITWGFSYIQPVLLMVFVGRMKVL